MVQYFVKISKIKYSTENFFSFLLSAYVNLIKVGKRPCICRFNQDGKASLCIYDEMKNIKKKVITKYDVSYNAQRTSNKNIMKQILFREKNMVISPDEVNKCVLYQVLREYLISSDQFVFYVEFKDIEIVDLKTYLCRFSQLSTNIISYSRRSICMHIDHNKKRNESIYTRNST
jgi:hypothetical protein